MNTLDRIKALAKKQGWSLQKVAEKAGIGINSIYRWNTKTPSTQSLDKVAKVLGVSADYLLGNTSKNKPLILMMMMLSLLTKGGLFPMKIRL